MNPISGKPEPYQAFTDKYSRLVVSTSGIFFMVGPGSRVQGYSYSYQLNQLLCRPQYIDHVK